jgi:hypothetical protein
MGRVDDESVLVGVLGAVDVMFEFTAPHLCYTLGP